MNPEAILDDRWQETTATPKKYREIDMEEKDATVPMMNQELYLYLPKNNNYIPTI